MLEASVRKMPKRSPEENPVVELAKIGQRVTTIEDTRLEQWSRDRGRIHGQSEGKARRSHHRNRTEVKVQALSVKLSHTAGQLLSEAPCLPHRRSSSFRSNGCNLQFQKWNQSSQDRCRSGDQADTDQVSTRAPRVQGDGFILKCRKSGAWEQRLGSPQACWSLGSVPLFHSLVLFQPSVLAL